MDLLNEAINTNRYKYNFSNLESALEQLLEYPNPNVLKTIKKELNKFFKDSECRDIIFSRNTDKFFFGMAVYAVVNGEEVGNILLNDEAYRIKEYYIEIDSKIFDLALTAPELTAIVLHEIGHLVNDSSPIEEVRHAIDDYMQAHNEVLDIKESIHFKEILGFAIKDTLRKVTSIFTRKNDEILADEFVFMCGYGEELESAFTKICSMTSSLSKDAGKFIVLQWTLQMYKNLKLQRLSAIKILNKTKRYTASKLEQHEIDNVIKSLNKIDDIALQEATYILENIKLGSSLIQRIQLKGLRGIEDDAYEYEMRIKNVEDEDDALFLMRQMNSRMSLLDEYLRSAEVNNDRERWQRVYDKYSKLRETLSKKTVYSRKMYGVWANYNYLDVNR